jgi:hypothetical protein
VTDYPFLEVVWTMFVFFGMFLWIWLLIAVFGDVFRRHDIGAGQKTLWSIFVLVLPVLGAFVYLIAEGRNMAERSATQAQASRAQQADHIRPVAGGGAAAEIERGKQLLDSGAISDAEFDALKTQALAAPAS